MKPSPENTSPISRLNSRKQLDLCSDLPNHLRVCADDENRFMNLYNDRLVTDTTLIKECNPDSIIKSFNQVNRTPEQTASVVRIVSPAEDTISGKIQGDIVKKTQYSKDSLDPISALESRRISNQLARAQFLANTPTSTNPSQNLYFSKRFRARSESPQHAATQNVARSPSAPTLETAL